MDSRQVAVYGLSEQSTLDSHPPNCRGGGKGFSGNCRCVLPLLCQSMSQDSGKHCCLVAPRHHVPDAAKMREGEASLPF